MKFSVRELAHAALIAAAYAALSWVSSLFGLTFGPIQLRLSESLCVLPRRERAAVPGLALGCLLTNLLSPYGLLDMVFGTLGTVLAALWSARCRTNGMAALAPVICNGLIVGVLLAWEETGLSAAFPLLFAYNAVTVALGEALVCFGLGVPLMRMLEKREVQR